MDKQHIQTLGALKKAGYESKSIKDELGGDANEREVADMRKKGEGRLLHGWVVCHLASFLEKRPQRLADAPLGNSG